MKSSIVSNSNNRTLNTEEFRAFTLVDKIAPLIFINDNDEYGKLFSLIHELVHVYLGKNNLLNTSTIEDVNSVEIFCNAVTGNFFVPKKIFTQKWHELNYGTEKDIINYINESDKYSDKALISWSDYNIADPWIIATAKTYNYVVITLEQLRNTNTLKNNGKVYIPEICEYFEVECKDIYYMLDNMNFKF
ncbi:MAG: DUF4411 family protein [Defluviitaleaceae bacterium]|nr:DUF4411 family protein [Defluviitaleaceae bacterium]